MPDAEAATGTKARLIRGLRDCFESALFRLAELAVPYKNRGVVGFDLAGGEAGNPAKLHIHAFACPGPQPEPDLSRGRGLGPASINQALHDCGAHRIGHGVTLREDEDLLHYVIYYASRRRFAGRVTFRPTSCRASPTT